MKKIILYIFVIILIVIMIPLLILGGVGPGIHIEGSNTPDTSSDISHNTTSEQPVKIKVYITKQNKIEELDLEEYVKGVVAAEMPVSFNIEALKAQSVAARTFAVARMVQFGGSGEKDHPGADVCDSVHCQAYLSKQDRFKSWSPGSAVEYWNKISQAVDSTKGMILTYNGELARDIKYHSTSGGKTEDNINVFNTAVPYLVSVDSPNEEEAPKFQSEVKKSISDFIKIIKQNSPGIKLSSQSISSQIKITEWTSGERVKTIKIGDKTFTGTQLRWWMGLNSAWFSVKVTSKEVIFSVRGNGHGVGLSQWGANEMGKKGSKYDEILKHYYKGTEIKKINEIFKNKNG